MKVFKTFFITFLMLFLFPAMLFSQTMKYTGHSYNQLSIEENVHKAQFYNKSSNETIEKELPQEMRQLLGYKRAFETKAASFVETQDGVSGVCQIAQMEMEQVQQPEQIAPRHREDDLQPREREQPEERHQVEMEREVPPHERFPEQREGDAPPGEGEAPPEYQPQTFEGYLSPQREDPLVSTIYSLEVGGKFFGHFTTCSGVGSKTEIAEHQVVNKKGQEVIKKAPGRLKWLDVTLKRGITSNMSVWNWRQQVVAGNINTARKNFSIILLDQQGTPVARWNFKEGWPSKVEGQQSSVMGPIETLVITHEGMSRVK